ncbi:SDR family oxidoreductase [Paenarthrobacter nicotinovorans]|uniref:SDR family oxidoreductase n=1 Tax=Paenarthrobacter nicotinovorans TaxID=29320 RepID=UPI00166EB61A|nr:SDR family oxidoreductase [Paenarthrobacter nicotinovorans]MBP2392809.1 NAD(P)-dependent dehydrogenase (short-subunit alcohol dehydrogenase family) [Paenarthrobacter nicotinovorans]UKF00893.1 SDR family oxidoreductase [Paenarthrobacter nicotinovorans]UKF05676.1 SDR family oxidoreductase [Paenarthrobacter nicotinovorans]GGV28406.1 short-chain dehydrogenase [Paenarthrobacter nicotinovorans]
MNFTDQTVIVTGAGSGIGRAAALRFSELGANIVIADKNEAAAREVADEAGAKALAVTVDVSDSASVRSMIKTVVDNFGGIDVLCNNAGFGFPGNVLDIDEDNWDRLMSVNLKGVYLCSKYAIPELAKTGDGRIVNTSSYTANVGIRDRAAYVASKGGVSALTRAMALDHVDQGIRVNAVAPGTINSPYFDKMIAESPEPQELVDSLNGRSPMQRMGRPEEVAEAIVWLAAKESSFATGSVLTVDGGTSTW